MSKAIPSRARRYPGFRCRGEVEGELSGARRQASTKTAGDHKVGQVSDSLCLVVGDASAKDCTGAVEIQDVDVLTVLRQVQPAHAALGEFSPRLSLDVEEHEAGGVGGDGYDVFSVGRPARREEILRSRKRGDLVGCEVEHADGGSRGCVGSVVGIAGEDDLRTVGRPVRILLMVRVVRQQDLGTSAIGGYSYMRAGFEELSETAKKMICLPSGDQRGMTAYKGG